MSESPAGRPSIGTAGALSIGIGGIVGGGFFATFGLTIAGAKGGTPLAFLIGGAIALLTAYSYLGLTLRYPGPGGTTTFIRNAFGQGLFAASANVLLVLSYVAIMEVYAAALASYSVPYLPAEARPVASHVIASLAVIVLGLVNFAGASSTEKVESYLNIGKLGVLGLFIVAGFLIGPLDWGRLTPAAWPPVSTVVASGMLGFLAYEGFELIANASGDIANPRRALPIAFLGSVGAAIMIYVLAFVVAIGHMPFEQAEASQSFAISVAAGNFLGPVGFGMMAIGAIFASASAINADYFGAAKLPVMLAEDREMPSEFHRSIQGKSVVSLATIGVLALLSVNALDLEAISAATSGGFLIVFAAVNLAAFRLAPETGARRWVAGLATLLCLLALIVMVGQFLSDPKTVGSGVAIAVIMALSILIELAYRVMAGRYSKMA